MKAGRGTRENRCKNEDQTMIYTFKITSNEKKDFVREIGINADQCFSDLHQLIQETSCFSSDQLASFFLVEEGWKKKIEITLIDMGLYDRSSYVMHKTRLSELLNHESQRLLYVFDFFFDRSYYVELIKISMGKHLKEPVVAYSEGDAPVQILEEDFREQGSRINGKGELHLDYGDLEDYNEIFGEMYDLL